MELRLDEIKGLMVEEERSGLSGHEYCLGFNEARTQQGKRKITINREKLERLIFSRVEYQYLPKKDCYMIGNPNDLSDSILSHLNELIESVPDET